MGDDADHYRFMSAMEEGERDAAVAASDTDCDQARREGFLDCEDLVIAWLERKAAEKPRGRMSFELRSAALAIRLGEHRRAQEEEEPA